MMLRLSSTVLSAVLCASAWAQGTIVDVAMNSTDLTTLVAAVTAAPVVAEALSGTDPLTVFAPLDSAFASVDQRLLESLLTPEYVAHLTNLLLFHATEGTALSSSLMDGQTLTMANDENITVLIQDAAVILTYPFEMIMGSASVVTTDIAASNGVIHTIDQVLFPKWTYTNLFTLFDELKGQGYDTVIGLFETLNLTSDVLAGRVVTVLAPNDEAFANAPDEVKMFLDDPETYMTEVTQLLTAHVIIGRIYPTANMTDGSTVSTFAGNWPVTVDGDTYMIGDATIVQPDVLANDGIIQGIDALLLRTSTSSPAPTPAMDQTILELANSTDALSTLFTAIAAAPQVAAALSGTDPYTVFAPLDSAFASFSQDELEQLLTPEYEAHLTNLLLFHATGGTTLSSSLTDGQTLTMANNETLIVSVQDATVSLTYPFGTSSETATVVTANITALNGVVHTIDQVLLPKWVSTDLLTLADELKGQGYDTIIGLLDFFNFTSDLLNGVRVTIFAPSDEAFQNAPDEVKSLLEDPTANSQEILNLLISHVVIGRFFPTASLNSDTVIQTLNGDWPVTVNGDTYTIGDSTIINPDVLAMDGIIQGIDTVLFTISASPAPTVAPASLQPTAMPMTPTFAPSKPVEPTAAPTVSPNGSSAVSSHILIAILVCTAAMVVVFPI